MSFKTAALAFDARATLARRVLPVTVTLGLWVILIEIARLSAEAF